MEPKIRWNDGKGKHQVHVGYEKQGNTVGKGWTRVTQHDDGHVYEARPVPVESVPDEIVEDWWFND